MCSADTSLKNVRLWCRARFWQPGWNSATYCLRAFPSKKKEPMHSSTSVFDSAELVLSERHKEYLSAWSRLASQYHPRTSGTCLSICSPSRAFEAIALFSAAGRRNFVPAGTRNFDLGEIYRDIILPTIDHREQIDTEAVPLPSRYHGFAIAALVLLLLDSVLRDGPRRTGALAPRSRREQGMAA